MSSTESFADLIAYLESPASVWAPDADILKLRPDLSVEDAYWLQKAFKKREAARHGGIIGYQASFTSRAARKVAPKGLPVPIFGPILGRNWHRNDAPMSLKEDLNYVLECEVGVLLKNTLAGPGVTTVQAISAIEGFFPALEVPPVPKHVFNWSPQHTLAVHNYGSHIVFGSTMTRPGIDLRLEGMVLRIDGEITATAAAAEALNDPINVVVAMANHLARYELSLESGMILMPGSLTALTPIPAQATNVQLEFTRLGGVFTQLDRSACK